jgi:hypothetical protein
MSILAGDVERLPEGVRLIHRLFERNCNERDADNQPIGVRMVDSRGVKEVVSYNTINQLGNAAARCLAQLSRTAAVQPLLERQNGKLNPGRCCAPTVVVDIDPGVRLLVGLLATLKLGLAYVPVESRSTAVNRIKYILQVLMCVFACM